MSMTNTYVSDPNAPAPAGPGAPGSNLPGANIPTTAAILIPLGLGFAALFAVYKVAGATGEKLPPIRVDAANMLSIYASWYVVQIPLKLAAYKFHGHSISQAFLLTA